MVYNAAGFHEPGGFGESGMVTSKLSGSILSTAMSTRPFMFVHDSLGDASVSLFPKCGKPDSDSHKLNQPQHYDNSLTLSAVQNAACVGSPCRKRVFA